MFMFSKKINFSDDFSEITFAFTVTPCEKCGCGRPYPGIIFQKKFDLCLPIKYKIRLLKAQVLRCYRTFLIQKSYGEQDIFAPQPK